MNWESFCGRNLFAEICLSSKHVYICYYERFSAAFSVLVLRQRGQSGPFIYFQLQITNRTSYILSVRSSICPTTRPSVCQPFPSARGPIHPSIGMFDRPSVDQTLDQRGGSFIRRMFCPLTRLPVHPSIHPSVSPSVRRPIPFVYLSVGLSLRPSARLCAVLSACPFVCPSVHISASPSIRPSIGPSLELSSPVGKGLNLAWLLYSTHTLNKPTRVFFSASEYPC